MFTSGMKKTEYMNMDIDVVFFILLPWHMPHTTINSSWHKTLNELNCHLHPLDTIATKTRAALKQCKHSVAGKVRGKDCTGNIVLQMNTMQYQNGKGDPRGFTTFLYNERLPCGIIP